MLDLILGTARKDARIRAVILNGSRANPNINPDRFQDFDIVYLVREVAPFVDDPAWIDRFGERMIAQMPDLMEGEAPRQDGGFSIMMQFTDGNRIDLTLIPINRIGDMKTDSLSVLLLDKDDRFPPFPPASEVSYLPQPPSAKAFAECCNEFWWVAPYVTKALARSQILYAHHLLDVVLRTQLMKMLTWWFGIKTNFQVNPGKYGQHFKTFFPPDVWARILNTYQRLIQSKPGMHLRSWHPYLKILPL